MLSSSLGFLDQFSPARYRLQYEMCGEKGLGNMTVLQIRSLGKVLKAYLFWVKLKYLPLHQVRVKVLKSHELVQQQ